MWIDRGGGILGRFASAIFDVNSIYGMRYSHFLFRKKIPVPDLPGVVKKKFMPYHKVSKASVIWVLYWSGLSGVSSVPSGVLSFSKPFLP